MRRRSYYRGKSRKAGLPPGTLVHTGYFDLWGVMLVISLAMILYFKRKRWL